MARFTFTIESEEEVEMARLMVGLFHHDVPKVVSWAKPDAVEEAVPVTKPKAVKAKPVAVVEPEPEPDTVVQEAEEAPEITLQALKHLGSQAMSHPQIKAAGIAAVLSEFGNGADSFASLKEEYYPAVHKELSDRL